MGLLSLQVFIFKLFQFKALRCSYLILLYMGKENLVTGEGKELTVRKRTLGSYLDDNNNHSPSIQCKRRAVLQDVVNVRCKYSYLRPWKASKIKVNILFMISVLILSSFFQRNNDELSRFIYISKFGSLNVCEFLID
jgi:hypothetical protein